ncbi:zinc finger BED domain-containing protein RICESLEEPER 2-like [Gossypium hirsutum]|uniref:Zinc finger BED domain-containing protein RICESLEEPER 2-like n=1 Tax=Gossypium hirsutum TaxID=3635 RepID=A0ABM3A1B1_GOSHI|nr:zinc finger BED domain-containing protein RICESLEEPER 2-like [Gossypium hirsutum]
MVIEKCLLNWGFDKLFTVTVGNASSNDVAIGYLRNKFYPRGGLVQNGKYLHMRCMTHIVNSIVVKSLKEMNKSVERVRGAVRYVRQSPARLQKFKECVVVEKIECKKMLCLNVCTRWNSTYLMLNTAQNFKRPFERFEEQDTNFRAELERREGWLSVDDWDNPPLHSTCSQSSVPTHVSLGEPQQKMKRRMQALYKKRELEIFGEDKTFELDKYLAEANEKFFEDFDILLWWKVNSTRFLTLSKMARDVLAILISTIASESAFSTEGCVLDQFRSSLTPKIVQALVCTQYLIRKSSSQEDIKKIEE